MNIDNISGKNDKVVSLWKRSTTDKIEVHEYTYEGTENVETTNRSYRLPAFCYLRLSRWSLKNSDMTQESDHMKKISVLKWQKAADVFP